MGFQAQDLGFGPGVSGFRVRKHEPAQLRPGSRHVPNPPWIPNPWKEPPCRRIQGGAGAYTGISLQQLSAMSFGGVE